MNHPIMWYRDQSEELKDLLDVHGYDEEEFLVCLPDGPGLNEKEARLHYMNIFLANEGGSGQLWVIDVREVEDSDMLEWRFEGDPIWHKGS